MPMLGRDDEFLLPGSSRCELAGTGRRFSGTPAPQAEFPAEFPRILRGGGRIDTVAPELDQRFPAFGSPAFLNGTLSSSVAFLNGTRGISSLLPRFQGNAPHALLLGRADRAVDAGFRRVADGDG